MNDGPFNVLTDPWIRVSWVDHSRMASSIGLRELLLRAHEIADIQAPLAPGAAGLMRILVAITARVTGLDEAGGGPEWSRRRQDLLAESAGGFDPEAVERVLGDEDEYAVTRFLQEPRLTEQCTKAAGVNKLMWTRVSGANPVFLSHDHDQRPQSVAAADAMWHLLAWLYYGPAGRCATRRIGDVAAADTRAGPLRRTLSVHPWGDNLYETLLLNQVYLPPSAQTNGGLPWQRTAPVDPLTELPDVSGIVARLTARFRHSIQLVTDDSGQLVTDAYITWAWRQEPADVDDPYVPYQVNNKGGRYPLYATSDRAIWRDLDSLILERPPGEHDNRPQILTDATELPAAVLERLRVKVFGFDQDGQTRDKAFFQALTPPILGALKHADTADKVSRAHSAGTKTGEQLRKALDLAWKDIATGNGAHPVWRDTAMARYWTKSEDLFWKIVTDRETEPLLPNAFIRIALEAYETATEALSVNTTVARAIESHRTRLFKGWKKETTNDDSTNASMAASVEQRHQRHRRADEEPDEYDW